MQRYFLENYPDRDAEMDEHPTGYWVKYSDACAEINKAVEANNTAVFECVKAQSALAALEKRVKELEAALKDVSDILGTGACKINICEGCQFEMREAAYVARAALEAPHEP